MKLQDKMAAVVEFQAFLNNDNKYIIKEFVIIGDSFQTQIIFKSPFCKCALDDKQQRTARWLSRHLHGIKWEDGTITYNEGLIKSLCKQFDTIYTKGREKAEFLKQFHPNVFELTNVSSNDVNNICILPQHSNLNFKCALRSAVQGYKSLTHP